jgi:hypothetical protein
MKTNLQTSMQNPFIFFSKRRQFTSYFSDIKNHQKHHYAKTLVISCFPIKNNLKFQLKYALSAYYQIFRLKLIAFAIGKVCVLSDIRPTKHFLLRKNLAPLFCEESGAKNLQSRFF